MRTTTLGGAGDVDRVETSVRFGVGKHTDDDAPADMCFGRRHDERLKGALERQ